METFSVEYTYTYTGVMQVKAKSAALADSVASAILNSKGPNSIDVNDEQFLIVSIEKSK